MRIQPSEEPAAPNWSRALVEAGLAIVDPGANQVFCQPELLPLEATARERRLGVWADARYNPWMSVSTSSCATAPVASCMVEGRCEAWGERTQQPI